MELKLLIATAASATLLVATQPSPADAHHRPNEWCPHPTDSNSRWCLNAKRSSDGTRELYIFRDGGKQMSYRVCVTAPDDTKVCRRFRLVEAMGVAYDDVVWREHFPNKGRGAYKVVWRKLNGNRIGVPLGFHVR